jgi:FKBP-type peptidyl-prolyl cis-trans isomerase (trigger factor)
LVTVSTRPEPGSKMVLEIEVTPDEVDRHFATAYRHVAERTRVPGFRPGKAPRQVIDELREQQATLRPIDGRGAVNGDIASVKFVGTIDGEPFEGGSADRLPLVIGEDRMTPGWEEQLIGLEIGGTKGFEITFPDDEFAKSVSDVETLEALRAEVRDALEKRADAEARHLFGDRIIDFATANEDKEGSRYFPDQADIPQHMTLWDASNYKTASRARQLPCDSLYCPTPMA